MLATQIRQKDAVFYFASYPAEDILNRVKFINRFYSDDKQKIEGDKSAPSDEIAAFIQKIEKSDKSFQREISKRKVSAIKNFYETAVTQPPIPATVLLFTPEVLNFQPLGNLNNVGNLDDPKNKFLIIDGQHRLAALEFYFRSHPEEASTIHVPCIIFDGKSDDFATEMFVIINSTPTRINKSHLIDLYEKVSWTSPDKKMASQIAEMLYSESDSPMQYRINRLGGRSAQKKWILQAELFNEIHRWMLNDWKQIEKKGTTGYMARYYYFILRDFFKAAQKSWEETWDNEKYMVTNSVSIKAMIRVCADISKKQLPAEEVRVAQWVQSMQNWKSLKQDFRKEGFYERFVAKGQVERVNVIYKKLLSLLN